MHTSGWDWYREADDAHVRQDNARLRAVLGHCPRCIAVLDEHGNLAGFNREFQSLFSQPLPIGQPIGDLFDEGPRAMLAEVIATAGTRHRAGAMVSMHTTAGEEHEYELLIATLPGDEMHSIGVVIAAEDRTERVHEESKRALVARTVGDANTHGAINLAQAAMCHDLNNVLSVLTLAVGSLRAYCGTRDPEVATLLRELTGAVKHGAEVVARANVSSRVYVPRRETTDVRECIDRATQVVAPLAREAKVTLQVNVVSDARVALGGTQLTQVLTNLMTNSVHAIQDAHRSGRIEVTVDRATPDAVTLCVRDDGVGIEPSRLVDSFEAFQTTRAERGGTGLGLAIAREIIEGAGGHIDVLSTPGRATEMRLELPATLSVASAGAVA